MVKQIVIRSIATAAATVLLIEIVFRVFPPPGLSREVLLHGGTPQQLLITPHPYIGYTLTPSFNRPLLHHNALGFRGPEISFTKPAGTLRVLCLGDSSTYGFSISRDEMTWPVRLQMYLNANAPSAKRAVIPSGSEESGGRVARGSRMYGAPRTPRPLALARGDTSQHFEVINAGAPGYSSFESLSMLEYRGLDLQPDVIVVYLGFNDLRASTWPKVQPDNSHFRKSWGLPEDRVTTALEMSETFLLARWYLTDYRHKVIELARYVIVPEDGDQLTHGLQPAKEQGFLNFGRNLRNIVAVSRAHGVRVLLLTQAYGEATIDAERGEIIGSAMTRLSGIVREVSAERSDDGVALLDARRLLPGMPGIFTDGVHMNDDGADFLARLIAARMIQLGWTERKATWPHDPGKI